MPNLFDRAAEVYKEMGLDVPDEKKKKLLDELLTILEKSNFISLGEKENIKKIMNFLPIEALEDLKNRLIEMKLQSINANKSIKTEPTAPTTKEKLKEAKIENQKNIKN